MTDRRHPVWFERPVLPAALPEVESAAVVLGPATADDPHHGLAGARAVIAGAASFDGPFMDHAPQLKVISRSGIGVDGVDLAAASERGIVVCNAPDAPTVSTAEHALALMLAVAKNLPKSAAELRRGSRSFYASHRGIELDGKTLGLVGYGRISRRLGAMAAGIGMEIQAHDPFLEPTAFASARRVETLEELVATSDVVSLHVPLTADSAGLFDADSFAAMKDGAVFINTARGGLVDQEALLAAIDSGKLSGAGLDVTDPEPLDQAHPLLALDNVVVTPHIASATDEGKLRLLLAAFRQAIQVLDGERPPNVVNPDVWNREEPNS